MEQQQRPTFEALVRAAFDVPFAPEFGVEAFLDVIDDADDMFELIAIIAPRKPSVLQSVVRWATAVLDPKKLPLRGEPLTEEQAAWLRDVANDAYRFFAPDHAWARKWISQDELVTQQSASLVDQLLSDLDDDTSAILADPLPGLFDHEDRMYVGPPPQERTDGETTIDRDSKTLDDEIDDREDDGFARAEQ